MPTPFAAAPAPHQRYGRRTDALRWRRCETTIGDRAALSRDGVRLRHLTCASRRIGPATVSRTAQRCMVRRRVTSKRSPALRLGETPVTEYSVDGAYFVVTFVSSGVELVRWGNASSSDVVASKVFSAATTSGCSSACTASSSDAWRWR